MAPCSAKSCGRDRTQRTEVEKVYQSDMFAVLVTSMFEDCQDNIMMNWLTSKLFYNNTYNQDLISKFLIDQGVTNLTTVNNMWFDNNYGFRNFLGLQTWIKIVWGKRSLDTGIGRYLITYFNITRDTMYNISNNASGWLNKTLNAEYSRHLF